MQKKGLLLPEMVLHLKYHLDPVQGPAGIRFRDILPLLIPEARFLILCPNCYAYYRQLSS
jgi:hypothetical protein